MQAVATHAPTRDKARERALEERLDELRLYFSGKPGASRAAVDPGIVAPEIDPWSCSQLQRFFGASGPERPGNSALVAHGIALAMKSRHDCTHLAVAKGEDQRALYEVQAELMLDTALGLALLREMRGAIERVVQAGSIEEAKGLNRLYHDLRNTVSHVKSLIAESARGQADRLSDSLTDQPRPQAGVSIETPRPRAQVAGPGENQPRVRLRKKRALAPWLPSRTEVLTTLLVLSIILWAGIRVLGGLGYVPPPPVRQSDFPETLALERLNARPPSLYVTLSTGTWNAMDPAERLDVVKAFGAVLLHKRYTGALFRTADGKPVARWMLTGGARLIETGEVAAAPPPTLPAPAPPQE